MAVGELLAAMKKDMPMTDTAPSLRGALEAVDAEVRHHLRSDEVDHAIIRKPVVAMVRAALAAHQPAHDVAQVIERLRADRDKAARQAEDQWAGWIKEEAARKRAERERNKAWAEIKRLMKERDEAYRKGQEDMRGRAAKVCFQTRGSTIAGTRIRALKIKGAPDAE